MSTSQLTKLKRKATEFEQKKQFDKALSLYIQFVDEAGRDLDDADLQLYNRVGDLLTRQGNLTEALAYYEKAVDMYAERGFLNNAIALCNKILRQSPARTVVYYKLGRISASKGFKSDARKNFLEYADRMQKAGQREEAYRALREFADLCPDQDDIRLMLADMLTKDSRSSEAIEQLEQLYARQQAEGRESEARATADRIKAIDPEAVPRQTGNYQAIKSNDLVFLDLEDAGKLAAKALTPRDVTPPAPVPIVEHVDVTGVGALAGLAITFLPDESEPPPAPAEVPQTRLQGLEVTTEMVAVPTASLPDLQLIPTEPAPEAATPLADIEATEWAASDEVVPHVDGLASPVVTLTGSSPLLAPLLDDPPLSGEEFRVLPIEGREVSAADVDHDLALASDLPRLDDPVPVEPQDLPLLGTLDDTPGEPDVSLLDETPDAWVEAALSAPRDDFRMDHLLTPLDNLVIAGPPDEGPAVVGETSDEEPEAATLPIGEGILVLEPVDPTTELVAALGDAPESEPLASARFDAASLDATEESAAAEPDPLAALVADLDGSVSALDTPPADDPLAALVADLGPTTQEESVAPIAAELAAALAEGPESAPESPTDLVDAPVTRAEAPEPLTFGADTPEFDLAERLAALGDTAIVVGAGEESAEEHVAEDAPVASDESFVQASDTIGDGPMAAPPGQDDSADDAGDSVLDTAALRDLVATANAEAANAAAEQAMEAAFAEDRVELPLLDLESDVAERDRVEAAADAFVPDEQEIDALLAAPPTFEDPDGAPAFEPAPLDLPEATGPTDEWPRPEVLIDGEWRDEHVGDLVSGEMFVVGERTDVEEPVAPSAAFDDLAAAMLYSPPDDVGRPTPTPSGPGGFSVMPTPRAALSFGGLEAQLRRRLELHPDDAGLRRQLGEALLDLGDRDGGLNELEVVVRQHEMRGELEAAGDVVDVILRVVPLSVRHHQKRVEYAARSGNRARLVDAYSELGDALFRCGEPDKAHVVYSRVLELSPSNERARFAIGMLSQNAGTPRSSDDIPAIATGGLGALPSYTMANLTPESVDEQPAPATPAGLPLIAGTDASAPSAGSLDDEVDAAFSGGDARSREARRRTEELEAVEQWAGQQPSAASPAPASDFVDLGDWLREQAVPRSTRMVARDVAPSGDEAADFAEMLRRFKAGVEENVEAEDYASHYDLGVAFKEMGLVDEAIGQFQRALRGEDQRVRAYEALGQCFVEKGQHEVALSLLQRAAEVPGTDELTLVGVLYLLGYASEQVGRRKDAVRYYQRVFAVDIGFRDVSARLAALERTPQ